MSSLHSSKSCSLKPSLRVKIDSLKIPKPVYTINKPKIFANIISIIGNPICVNIRPMAVPILTKLSDKLSLAADFNELLFVLLDNR